MVTPKKNIFLPYVAFALFLFLWCILTVFLARNADDFIIEFSLLFLCTGLAGIGIPILIADTLHFRYNEEVTSKKFIAGMLCFAAGIGIEIISSGSWIRIITENPSSVIRFKHILVVLPISIAVSLQLFLLFKAFEIHLHSKGTRDLLGVFASSIFFGFIMFLNAGFGDMKTLLVMTMIGLFVGAGFLLTKKFFLTLTALFLILYANALGDLKFLNFSWPMAVAGFLFCLTAIIYVQRNCILPHRQA